MNDNEVWVYDTNDWIKGILIGIEEDLFAIKINDVEYFYDKYEICNNIKKIEEKDNLVDIPNLNEPEILNAVNMRYDNDIIYTYTGKILIAVNPFKNLNLFTKNQIDGYKVRKLTKPHIYQIADKAYNNLLTLNKNQTILVSGESGAGKTYSVRNILNYLTCLSKKSSNIEKKVVESNPILEAFGNAKTLRNDNSSRFGKFIKVQIENYSILGCKIDTYLLEKIRIISQNFGERNFHIFYQLLLSDWREKYNLSKIENYNYLSNSYIECDNVNDKKEFDVTLNAFRIMGFNEVLIDSIFKIIAGVLNLGNIVFDEEGEIMMNDYFENVLMLLDIKRESLISCLCFRELETVGEIITIKMSKEDCIKSRNSLAMRLYSCVFDFIVENINESLKSDSESFIGILDIFGFESFEKNSFEQFCINYTNETLQEQFNKYMFKLEQKEYELEGVDWKNIEFPDNKECLSLIESKYGIIKMLDEECKLPRGSDKSFTNKLWKKYENNDNIRPNKKYSDTRFIIKHYAGDVEYVTTSFCEKNKDIISGNIKNIINSISIINDDSEITSKINMKTVAVQFKGQLNELINEISKTSSHYIRCIKPNDKNICDNFDRKRANQQIKYSGILAAIKVSRAGYPIRFKKNIFSKRYSIIKNFENTELLLKKIHNKNYAVGNTKIFLKNDAYNDLESKRSLAIKEKVILIQNKYRSYIARKKYKYILSKIVRIQCEIRRYKAKQYLQYLRKISASCVIQKYVRMWEQCYEYNKICKAILLIQKTYKLYRVRKLNDNATIIQRCYRRWVKYLIRKKINTEKEQWNNMVEIWNKQEREREVNICLEQLIRKIISDYHLKDIKKKQKDLELLQRKRNEELEKEKKEIEKEKAKINKMRTTLENENKLFNESISLSVNEKLSMIDDMEKLLQENIRMKHRLKTLNSRSATNCVIS